MSTVIVKGHNFYKMFKFLKIVLIFISVCYSAPASAQTTQCGTTIVACYFSNWAWYRPGTGKFLPSNIDATLCTHVLYAFAKLDETTLTIVPTDPWADIDNKFYELIVKLKNKGIKVLLSLGGWNDSWGNKYTRMVSDATARGNFIKTSIAFVKKYGFQGLDIDWEYPKCWQTNCNAGPDSDKPNFAQLLKELQAAYKLQGLLLTAAVSPAPRVIDNAYDIVALSEYLDFIGVMNYDYHYAGDGVTGANSPFDSSDGSLATIPTLEYYISKGANSCKLLVGIPMYARSFTLANPSNNGFGAPVSGPGNPGSYTRESGILSYYEVCTRIKDSHWTVMNTVANASYAYSGNQWASYCNTDDVILRANLVKKRPLGGAMIWTLDLDDFNNVCGCGKYPLLRTLNVGLGRLPGPTPKCY